ncbi:hypothetical protein A264_00470 [Pseudomonas syringae pv. actinidiae ICMP 19071]|nr:hypothetical protein A264_00470 [Pseudomonas syringae pv. actinidiae ICMP 19071]EPM80844.1 hypothetical protein A3SO_00530 [Pseudomonas syringae pv. actinidiae ICMP 19072]
MNMVGHDDPSERIGQLLLLDLPKFIDEQAPHAPIGKNRISLECFCSNQINLARPGDPPSAFFKVVVASTV